MTVFKCKMCGGDLQLTETDKVVECEYCGTTQTVPSADNEKKMTLFNRANKLRFNSEFDKAAGIYESIIADFPEEAEAYWGIVLCKYGIEYVDDPATGKKIPTCHRSSFSSVMEDDAFEQACENADPYARRVYRDEAKRIEEIRKGIIEVSAKEEPYDIFICYKETDEAGGRTLDSVIAQDVYDALTEKGYRVFFSRVSLEDKLGVEYEPYIFAALNSAKIMLAFGTDYEYFNAVWVKNEWSRFLQLIAAGEKKYLIPCFKDIDAYDMPKEFAKLQSQDMGKVGAMQDLLRGIEKILPRKEQTAVPVQTAAVDPASANTDNLLNRMFMFLEDGDWNSAKEYSNKVLDINASNAEAYLGALMAELKVNRREKLKDCKNPFDYEKNYEKAMRFGDEKLKAELNSYITHINERNENERLTGIYNEAQCIMRDAGTEAEYKKAAARFDSIAGFKDAKAQAEECRRKAEEAHIKAEKARIEAERKAEEARIEAERKAEEARIEAEKARIEEEQKADAVIRAILPGNKDFEKQLLLAKNNLQNLYDLLQSFDELSAENGRVQSAIQQAKTKIERLQEERKNLGLFAGKEKKRLDEEISQLNNDIPVFQKRSEALAEKLSNALGGYADKQQLQKAIKTAERETEALETEKRETEVLEASLRVDGYHYSYKEAVAILKNDPGVRTAVAKKDKYILFKAADIGGIILFGSYPQDNSGEKKTIEWRVLAIEDGRILVISEQALDCRKYHDTGTNITWENCSLRKWLNGTFLQTAFSAEEQAIIQNTAVPADKNPEYSISPGNSTTDKVFLLSIAEAERYFSSDEARRCAPAAFAKAQGAYTDDYYKTASGAAVCCWWLRSPGYDQYYVAYVINDGSVYYRGGLVHSDDCVRPALWLTL